tara:strand:- start:436 stop:1047 length:612 start_codon:yes stop_codon:yes gene_type:complete
MIGIINTNFGNLNSISNIYLDLGIDCMPILNPKDLENITKIIVPGIGNFDNVISKLKLYDLFEPINRLVINEKMPILGICIGMHIFYESSEEGSLKGFSWLNGKATKFKGNKLKYPHMGWNSIEKINQSDLFRDIDNNSYFYFLHSYINDADTMSQFATSSSLYGELFASSIKYQNIYGVQFHPEKSHKNGVKILSNFANHCA